MNIISMINLVTFMVLFTAIGLSIAGIVKKRLYAISGLFLILSLLAYSFVALSNILEHSRLSEVLDQYEEFFEVLIIPYFLLFIYSISSQNEINNREKNEEILEKTLEEREELLRELHHRVRNNLQVISSILAIQSEFIKDEGVKLNIQDTSQRVLLMGLFHKKVSQTDSFSYIDFSDYVQAIINEIKKMRPSMTEGVFIDINVSNMLMNIDTAIPCGLILYEIVSNSIQHAFSNRDGGVIKISASINGDGLCTLKISDNGIGLPDDVDLDKNNGLGMVIINLFITQLKGNVTLHREQGTAYTFVFNPILKEETRWQRKRYS